jgi:hypothetical protein
MWPFTRNTPTPPEAAAPASYFGGLDLGQSSDPSALALVRQTYAGDVAEYAVVELRRWPLGTPYPQIVADVAAVYADQRLAGHTLAVDATGVGAAVVDLFALYPGLLATVQPVLITSGQAVSRDPQGYWHVAKVQLVSTVKVLLGCKRLRFADGLKLRQLAEKELSTFQVKITANLNETYSSWREKDHDGIVLALAMALWAGENLGGWGPPMEQTPGNTTLTARAPSGVWMSDGMPAPWGGGGRPDGLREV